MRSRAAVGVAAMVAAGAAAASFLGGCGASRHLAQGHGVSREAFRAQRAAPVAAAAPDVTGLDSQEAAIVAEGYRRSLAPKGTRVEEQPVILVSPQKPAQRAPLAPSVPK